MKKSVTALLMVLVLLISGLPAGAEEAPVILINGIRTAFFNAQGEPLAPVQRDGILYVPAEQLGAGLGLDVAVDQDRLVVSINGIPAALFAGDGSYLPPVLENGIVYVGLEAFLNAAGVSWSLEGNAWSITGSGPKAGSSGASAPEPAATAVPQYGYIPLTISNYRQYLSIETGYRLPDYTYKQSSYTAYYTLKIQSVTTAGLENVQLRTDRFGLVRVPSSGYYTDTVEKTIYKYDYSDDTAWILGIGRFQTDVILSSVTVLDVSGKLRVSGQEALAVNGAELERARKLMDSGSLDRAEAILTDLISVDFAGSRELLAEVRAKKKEKHQAELQLQYEKASRAYEQGDYPSAISGFTALASENYSDSRERLAVATAAEQKQRFDQASAALEEGRPEEAVNAFGRLKEEGYPGAAEKEAEAIAADQKQRFDQASAALEGNRFEEAIDAFGRLKEEGYPGAAEKEAEAIAADQRQRFDRASAALEGGRFEEAIDAFGRLKEEGYPGAADQLGETWYQKAEALETAGSHAEAASAFERAGSLKDAGVRASAAWYHAGMAARESGENDTALNFFAKAGTYEDSAEQIGAIHYHKGEAAILDGDAETARSEFTLAGDYRNAEMRAEHASVSVKIRNHCSPGSVFDGNGYALLNDGRWRGAGILNAPGNDIIASGNSDDRYESTFRDGYALLFAHRTGNNYYYYMPEKGGKPRKAYSGYYGASPYFGGLAAAGTETGFVVIDREGKETNSVRLKKNQSFNNMIGEGLIRIRTRGKSSYVYGMVSPEGKQILPLKYDRIETECGLLLTENQQKSGKKSVRKYALFDGNGKKIFGEGKYSRIQVLDAGHFLVESETKKSGPVCQIVDRKGKVLYEEPGKASFVQNSVYIDRAVVYGSLLAWATMTDRGMTVRVVNVNMEQVVPGEWQDAIVYHDETVLLKDDAGWHICDLQGRPLTDEVYDECWLGNRYEGKLGRRNAESTYFWAFKGGKWYVLDLKGQVVY